MRIAAFFFLLINFILMTIGLYQSSKEKPEIVPFVSVYLLIAFMSVIYLWNTSP